MIEFKKQSSWATGCPCCGSKLLRHTRKSTLYLRCTSCLLEIPSEATPVKLLADREAVTKS
ncbi:MAG: hypothetical protein AAFN18_10715 [Cyanobacteria bacterium J06554_6]